MVDARPYRQHVRPRLDVPAGIVGFHSTVDLDSELSLARVSTPPQFPDPIQGVGRGGAAAEAGRHREQVHEIDGREKLRAQLGEWSFLFERNADQATLAPDMIDYLVGLDVASR